VGPGYSSAVARILAAGAVVTDRHGRFLLVLRGAAPQPGLWTVPGGRVEPGETLAAAAAREVREETGLIVRVLGELGSLEVAMGSGDVFEVHDFAADYVSGDLQAGDDAMDARWFTADMLPTLPMTQGLLGHLTRWGVYPGRQTDD
jgi:8-oxo-dGTP diphosphatase